MTQDGRPILIVDDDAFQRRMIRIKLQTHGFEVNEAKDGIEALEFLEQQDYRVVLLDIVMPQLNGWEVLDQIRSRHSRAELPVIMMTARDTRYDMTAALARGANDYLTKPIDFADLNRRIDSCTAAAAPGAAAIDQAATAGGAEDTHRDLLPHIAEQSLAMLDNLLGNLPGIVFRAVGDGNGNVHLSYQSDGLQSFLGHSWTSVQHVIACSDNRSRDALNRQFRSKGRLLKPLHAHFPVQLPNGATRWVECHGKPHRLPSGETVWDAILVAGRPQSSERGDDHGHTPVSDEAHYRDPQGYVHQCTRCRKVRDFRNDESWERVDEWTQHMPLQTRHTLCAACAAINEVATAG
ncbi:MAG: response regulator [Gammaproteobacteria bacterium]|jgi:CheY-like chemotaxis protein|nr:response regulator [Gammaproteobacteria bacterium]